MSRTAFLMGANGPAGPARLRFAASDVERLGACLSSPRYQFAVHGPEKAVDVYDLRRHLDKIAAKCSQEDTFLCYFGGHGELYKGELYLLLDNSTSDYFVSALRAKDVLATMFNCRARNKLLILNCCHAAGAIGAMNTSSVPLEEFGLKTANSLVLLASDRLEQAFEIEELGGSFLTTAICNGLQDYFEEADTDRDGKLSIGDLMNWLKFQTERHNSSQGTPVPTPILFGLERGREFQITLDVDPWKPYEIFLPNSTIAVILPIAPIGRTTIALGKHPVTNAQYKSFLDAHANWPEAFYGLDNEEPVGNHLVEGRWIGPFYPWREAAFNKQDQPVVCVEYRNATEYCRWLSSLAREQGLNCTFRLPPSRLWDFAAMGEEFLRPDPEQWLSQTLKVHNQVSSPAPIDKDGTRTNARGIADMFGNVWEWCGTELDKPFPSAWPSHDRISLRGGGFEDDLKKVYAELRPRELDQGLHTRHADIGFRVLVEVDFDMLPETIIQRLTFCKQVRLRSEFY